MYHIQIVGAGYTGSRIATYFRSKKQKVWTVTRSDKRNAEFKALGIVPLSMDLTKPETLQDIPPAHFIVICPAPGEKKDEAAYREIYLEGIGNYLSAIGQNPKPNLIVYLSSTGVYRERGGQWVDERTPPEPDTEKGKILLAAENQVLNSGFPAVVFRLAGIYGPGRNVIERPSQRRGAIHDAPASDIDRWMNLIHVEDVVGAMPVIFNKGEAGNVYLGVDDEPVLRSEFKGVLTNKSQGGGAIDRAQSAMNGAPPDKNPPKAGKRCSNQKLKALGYPFKYSTFREGYAAILANIS